MEDDDFDPLSLATPERIDSLSLSDEYGTEPLGVGGGYALQLDEHNNANYLSPSSPSSPRTSHSRQSSRNRDSSLGESLAKVPRRFFIEGTSSPMLSERSSGASSSEGGTRSLASELADAIPDRSASRDLLWELGLDEGDEEDGLGDEGGYDSEEEYGGVGDDTVRYEERMKGSSRGSRGRSRDGLLEERELEGEWTDPSERSIDLLRDLGRDTRFDETSALEKAFESTILLLGHLSPPTSSTSTGPNPLLVELTDQQPLIESLTSTLVRTLYESTKDRERQVQELGVLERLFVKHEVGWREGLSELEELSLEDHHEEVSLVKGNPIDPISIPADDPPLTVRHELASLQSITSSLISFLSTLHETTQVQKADSTKLSQQLRSLRIHISNYTEETISLSQSEDFIREYESRGREKGEYARAVGRIVKDVEEELSKGWERAKEVLVV